MSASAQSIPEGQSCGGLLCDVGVFGHKVDPAPKAPPPPAVATHVEAAPAVEPQSEPKPKSTHKRKRIAKAAASVEKAPALPETAAALKKVPPVAIARAGRPAAKSAKAATAALPLPAGWGATEPTPVEEALTPASVPSSPVAAVASPPKVETVAAQSTPIRKAAPATAASVRSSPILDPFSNIQSNQPFRPLY